MHSRSIGLATFVLVLVFLAAVAACTAAPGPLPVEVTDSDAEFRLTIIAPRTIYRSDEPIEVRATLTYIGPAAVAEVAGSGSGVVGFRLEDLEGPLDQEPISTSDCVPHHFARGVALQVPFQKSGGWSADDANAAFWKAFFDDPVLRLPAGRWRITAVASFAGRECSDDQHLLEAPLELVVV